MSNTKPWWNRTGLSVAALVGLCITVTVQADNYKIKMFDAPPYFSNLNLEAKVGDTVEWINSGPEMVHIVMDKNMTLFSQDIPVGKNWSHTFTKAGIYQYICHRHFFMRGTVTVKNPDGSTTSEPDFPYQPAFTEHVIPTLQSVPRMIITSKVDDRIWFTEGGGEFYGFEDIPAQNKIASINKDGQIVEFATPTPNGNTTKIGVDSLVMDKRGTIYFTERFTNKIGLLRPDGSIKEYSLPTKGGYALGVDIDSKGNIWFAERYGNRIGWMTPEGKITEIELPEKDSEPRTVFVDSKDRVWYTARVANEIGYYDSKIKRLVRLTIPTKLARPAGIAETTDGTIYFVEMVGNKVAKVVGNQIIEYNIPTPFSAPFKIVPDHDGYLWFTQVYSNSIGKFDPRSGQITEYKIPTIDSRPGGIAVDKQGHIWFTQQMGNKITQFDPVLAERYAEEDRLKRKAAAARAPSVLPGPQSLWQVPRPAASSAFLKASEISSGTATKFDEYRVPTAGAWPGNTLIEDGAGWLWFTEMFGNKVGAINVRTQEFKEILLPTPTSMPVGLAREPSGVLWVTLFRSNALVRIEPDSGAVIEYPIREPSGLPSGVTLGLDGDVWITLLGHNKIARFNRQSKTFTYYTLPIPDSNPLQIVAGANGDLWVSAAQEEKSYIAQFDPAKETFKIHHTPTPNAQPVGLLLDGTTLWVAEGGAGKLGQFDINTHEWQEHTIPGEKSQPVKLTKDRHGNIWISDGGELGSVGGNQLVVFNPATKRFSKIPMRTRDAKPMGITLGSDGNVWFTQQGANRISRITPESI